MSTYELQVVFFVNSGSEANELAMLMARLYTGNLGMIALRNAYHGGSSGTMGLTALNTWKYPIPQVCFFIFHHNISTDLVYLIIYFKFPSRITSYSIHGFHQLCYFF